MATRSVFADRKRRGPIEPRVGASWAPSRKTFEPSIRFRRSCCGHISFRCYRATNRIIRVCWRKVEWACGRILVRDGANAGWIDYRLKGRQKSAFDGFFDCVIVESFYNPNVGA